MATIRKAASKPPSRFAPRVRASFSSLCWTMDAGVRRRCCCAGSSAISLFDLPFEYANSGACGIIGAEVLVPAGEQVAALVPLRVSKRGGEVLRGGEGAVAVLRSFPVIAGTDQALPVHGADETHRDHSHAENQWVSARRGNVSSRPGSRTSVPVARPTSAKVSCAFAIRPARTRRRRWVVRGRIAPNIKRRPARASAVRQAVRRSGSGSVRWPWRRTTPRRHGGRDHLSCLPRRRLQRPGRC